MHSMGPGERQDGESCADDNKTPRYLEQTSYEHRGHRGSGKVTYGLETEHRVHAAMCSALLCCRTARDYSRGRDERARPAVFSTAYPLPTITY
jgi:hypothetical protein